MKTLIYSSKTTPACTAIMGNVVIANDADGVNECLELNPDIDRFVIFIEVYHPKDVEALIAETLTDRTEGLPKKLTITGMIGAQVADVLKAVSLNQYVQVDDSYSIPNWPYVRITLGLKDETN